MIKPSKQYNKDIIYLKQIKVQKLKMPVIVIYNEIPTIKIYRIKPTLNSIFRFSVNLFYKYGNRVINNVPKHIIQCLGGERIKTISRVNKAASLLISISSSNRKQASTYFIIFGFTYCMLHDIYIVRFLFYANFLLLKSFEIASALYMRCLQKCKKKKREKIRN